MSANSSTKPYGATTVSVVIPTFNRKGLVNKTVAAVLQQSHGPSQVIVVDDGSTDGTAECLQREFGSRIELVEQTNRGPGAARNNGLSRATGEFIWFMDSDDLASRNKLEAQVRVLEEQDSDIAYGPCVRGFISDDAFNPDGPVLQQRALPGSRDILTWFMTRWSVLLQQCLFRRSAIQPTAQFNESLRNGEDGEFLVSVLSNGAKAVFEDQSLTVYRCDDIGKLTGSGGTSTQRIHHWGKALLTMARHCRRRSDILNSFELQTRMLSAARYVERHSEGEASRELSIDLQGYVSWPEPLLSCCGLYLRLNKAIRRRLGGYHWDKAYQAGPLTLRQKHLLAELGIPAVDPNCVTVTTEIASPSTENE